MKKLCLYLLSAIIISGISSRVISINPPDEGMWLPIWIEKKNYEDMKRLGLKLGMKEVYSIDKPSLEDGVVVLGTKIHGMNIFICTGEFVSAQGLILTNHHCAYDAIQRLSSIEQDYLTNGFWAYSIEEELPISDMTISILHRIEDVTHAVLKDVNFNMTESERSSIISSAAKKIERDASERGKYHASVESFFEGNEYYLFVYETFSDVRLVGAPPSSIGKFGGDTDNWMWPRHTGDFAFLRVYTAPDGTPADYNENNIPHRPKHYFPVSIKGFEKNDFAMIFGYPGKTDRYMTSYGIDFQLKYHNPLVVKIREAKQNIMKSYMDKDAKIKLQYSSKYAQSSNYWKYFIGQTKGLEFHNVQERRKKLEDDFINWVNEDKQRKEKYSNILTDIENAYNENKKNQILTKYLEEAVFQGAEFIYFSFGAYQLYSTLNMQNNAAKIDRDKFNGIISELANDFMSKVEPHFKNYNINVDKDIFVALIGMMYNNLEEESWPSVFNMVKKKYKGNIQKWADYIYDKSIFVDEEKLKTFLKNPSYKQIHSDPGWEITVSMITLIQKAYADLNPSENKLNRAYRLLIYGVRQMLPYNKFYPDANSTMRMTYGKVLDYYPADAVHYDYITTEKGILKKEDPLNEEFIVRPDLKALFKAKDFGDYGINGSLPVCFLTDNDISGGNSGSPVLNAEGHLIGIAFDGNWEALSGDIQYEPSVQRTISVDIRYVLFITDKIANAKNLIEEMTIIR